MSMNFAKNKFSFCVSEERGVAVATPIDNNAVDGNSGKQKHRYITALVIISLQAIFYTENKTLYRHG